METLILKIEHQQHFSCRILREYRLLLSIALSLSKICVSGKAGAIHSAKILDLRLVYVLGVLRQDYVIIRCIPNVVIMLLNVVILLLSVVNCL